MVDMIHAWESLTLTTTDFLSITVPASTFDTELSHVVYIVYNIGSVSIYNHGIDNAFDSADVNNKVCQDVDVDMCDDCAIGVDGFAPLFNADAANDGLDADAQSDCNVDDFDDYNMGKA